MEKIIRRYHYGFDYLRIILCIAVVALHTNIFSVPHQYSPTVGNPIWYNIALLFFFWIAVPTFFQMSLYLYAENSVANTHNFKARLKHLCVVYLFWGILGIDLLNNGNIKAFIGALTPSKLVLIIASNFTIYYFLFALIYLTVVTEVCIRFLDYFRYKAFPLAIMLLISLVAMFFGLHIVEVLTGSTKFANDLGFSNPFNFLPYVFSAQILVLLDKRFGHSKGVPIIFFILFCLVALIEWQFLGHDWYYFRYCYVPLGRPSLVVGSMFFVSFFKLVNTKTPAIIQEISKLTLGIFLVHTIVLSHLSRTLTEYRMSFPGYLFFCMVFFMSALISYIIRNVKGII